MIVCDVTECQQTAAVFTMLGMLRSRHLVQKDSCCCRAGEHAFGALQAATELLAAKSLYLDHLYAAWTNERASNEVAINHWLLDRLHHPAKYLQNVNSLSDSVVCCTHLS